MTTTPGIKPEYMNKSVDPGRDFYGYCNGTYVKNAVLPPGYTRWGSFMELNELSLNRAFDMMTAAAAAVDAPFGSNTQKVGDFFASGMDEEKIEAERTARLTTEFATINKVRSRTGLAKTVARLHSIGVRPFFAFGASQSFDDSSQMIATAGQSGLGLSRDHYVDADDASIEKRRLYVEHIARMLQLIGEQAHTAQRHARSIMSIETALAFASMEQADMRDPKNINNVMSTASLANLTPSFDFHVYLQAINAPTFSMLNVMQPNFFVALENVLSKASMSSVRAYLRWKLISAMAPYLSSDFVDERFAFYGVVMNGLKEQQPRYKRVANVTDGALGHVIGQLYVEKFFPPEAKARVLNMIEDGKAEMRLALETTDWLSDTTRSNLLNKLDKTIWKIGYPDKWADYSDLVISRDSYVINVIRANERESRLDLEQIGKPRDKFKWYMTPQTVNAYADPQSNEVVFPAAILQPPFFDIEADDAANYGGILVVILHEFGHLFDDDGANFDADGNVNMQWTESDLATFMKRIQLIRNQFGQYTVGKNKVHLKGDLVSGEAAADLNGVNLSYRALMRRLATTERKTINGFTDEQRFFISFGQIWAGICTPESAEEQAKSDPHPAEHLRVNGTLANVAEFPQSFGLADNCPIMLPEQERCHIW